MTSTSQPVQTGFSADWGSTGAAAKTGGGNGSVAGGIRIAGSLLRDGGSRCGSSGDDKQIPQGLKPDFLFDFPARLKAAPLQILKRPKT
jgi:hypothetical protein